VSIHTKVVIMCDICHEWDDATFDNAKSKNDALTEWLSSGWSASSNNKHLCTDCVSDIISKHVA
jgi:hypothetical protein